MKRNTIVGLGICPFGYCEKRSRIKIKVGGRMMDGLAEGLTCSIYSEASVESFKKRGSCPYDEVGKFRLPSRGGKLNPLKANKRGE